MYPDMQTRMFPKSVCPSEEDPIENTWKQEVSFFEGDCSTRSQDSYWPAFNVRRFVQTGDT